MTFNIDYADTMSGQVRRREQIEAVDIDVAARIAVETCPEVWFVSRVEQADVYAAADAA